MGKNERARHDNTFYLFEALIKLSAICSTGCYLKQLETGGDRHRPLDDRLRHLALPSLGHWVGFLRESTRFFGERPDSAIQPMGHIWQQLTQKREDLPATLKLFNRISNGPDGEPTRKQSCSLLQLFDALVQYRNSVFGHGGQRFDAFYETEMGPLLLPTANEILQKGVFNYLGPDGSRLVFVNDVRPVDETQYEVRLKELNGLHGRAIDPITYETRQIAGLAPNRVALLWPGADHPPLVLEPLLIYREYELAEEVLFLNRDRTGRQVEYLSYATGRTERETSTVVALSRVLTLITGQEVSSDRVREFQDATASETDPMEFASEPVSGNRQLGDFEILCELERGGMGIVYLARQLSLGRIVALKTLPAKSTHDQIAARRFRREINALGRLDHPNIVKVLASGKLPDGQLYFAMEYVAGANLESVWRQFSRQNENDAMALTSSDLNDAVLSASRNSRDDLVKNISSHGNGPSQSGDAENQAGADDDQPEDCKPTPTEFLPTLRASRESRDKSIDYQRRLAMMFRDLATALHEVHERGIIHRDVKPANLMMTSDGARAVLMDFGLAKSQTENITKTAHEGLLGTLRYAGPEQLTRGTRDEGPSTDVRGLGTVLWEFLTRQRLFGDAADERQLTSQIMHEDVPRVRSIDRSIDPDLEAIVAKAVERNPVDRIQSCREMADYLDMYLAGEPLPIRPPGLIELAWRRIRENPVPAGAIALLVVTAIVGSIVLRFYLQYREDQSTATAMVEKLSVAQPQQLPDLANDVLDAPPLIKPMLEERLGSDKPNEKLRAAMGLSLLDPTTTRAVLQQAYFDCNLEFVVPILTLLEQSNQLIETDVLRPRLIEPDSQIRMRSAGALAKVDLSDNAWAGFGRQTVTELVRQDDFSDIVNVWWPLLKPARFHLDSSLLESYQTNQDKRDLISQTVAHFYGDDPAELVEFAIEFEPHDARRLYPLMANHKQKCVEILKTRLQAKVPARAAAKATAEDKAKAVQERLEFERRLANAAASFCKLAGPAEIWELFRWRTEHQARSNLITRILPDILSLDDILARLENEQDVSTKRALILVIGNYALAGGDSAPDEDALDKKVVDWLVERLTSDDDPGVHSACRWSLQRWGQDVDQLTQQLEAHETGSARWRVNSVGHTLVSFNGPINFQMGSPEEEIERFPWETLHTRKLPRSFEIATCETTVAQFKKFRRSYRYNDKWAATDDCPAGSVSWFDAANYCNWLSKQEGIPEDQWCYPKNFRPGMKPFPDYLKRTGYRMPTESEWEFASRAGATTSYSFGDAAALLPDYGNFLVNSDRHAWPAGTRMPNDFGMFDMYGNGYEWCADRFIESVTVVQPATVDVYNFRVDQSIPPNMLMNLRGGSAQNPATECRSAIRNRAPCANAITGTTFRVARTVSTDSASD